MFDVMKIIWSKRTDGRRGNTLFVVTVLKMKHIMKRWFAGTSGEKLQQVHLHMDGLTLLMSQKHNKQREGDAVRILNV